ncbi:nucleotidyltransferase domain-containing protein [Streptomyces rubiginosohelvolus]|uniref:nucleotidyltransferase domain-containing protein n=1 Tax=Streptomyces rubiginosohelvolus TaxID=67362 RepID=UPI0036A209A7
MNKHLSQCLDVLRDRKLLPDDTLAVFVVGSTARGWTHATSDIDVVVITRSVFRSDQTQPLLVSLSPEVLPVSVFSALDRRWEVKYWADDQVDQLYNKVTWDAFEEDQTIGDRFGEVEELFLGRLLSCAVISGGDWISSRQRQLGDSAFRSLLVMRALTEADEAAETAIGQMMAGDAECAVLSAREAFGWAVQAILVDQHQYDSGVKWRPRRFRLVAPGLLTFDEYWAIETMRDFDPVAPETWVQRVVEVCKKVSMEIEV